MKHDEIINEALRILKPRGDVYGTLLKNHQRIARIANELTGRNIFSAYDVAMLMVAVKLSRIVQSPDHVDSYVDAINYLSFAGEFATDAGER